MQRLVSPLDFSAAPRRSKRLQGYLYNKEESRGIPENAFSTKRLRSGASSSGTFDIIADKENFHRVKQLAPRSRPAKVLIDLVIDLPTDASDYEISESEDSVPASRFLLNQLSLRMADSKNDHYNFQVYEDPL